MQLLIATNNKHKVREISNILVECKGIIRDLSGFGDYPKPVENGETYYENALIKAMHYHRLTGLPTIADDSGLEIDALEGQPGIYSARYIDPSISFEQRNKLVLEKMLGVPESMRGARFRCCCVLVLSKNDIRVEYGVLEGRIGYELKGRYGFGYDPIFVLPDKGVHLAEVEPEEKNKISHRAQAFMRIKPHLSVICA